MVLSNLTSMVFPAWVRYAVYTVLGVVLFGYGYVKGLDHANTNAVKQDVKTVYVQGQTTTKVITKYIKIKEKQDVVNKEIKNEGDSYTIKFPNDTYRFNNEYVSVYDESITGTIPSLSSGKPGDSTDVSVSENLAVSVNNNIAGRYWKQRALTCEEWVDTQEKESIK